MGLRIREILIAIPNNRTKLSLHFRFLQALQGEHPLPAARYDIKGRKYVGLRNARLNFRQQEPTHIMENIVYNELLIRGYNVDVGIVEAYAKNDEGKTTRKQFEVDFVVNQGSQRYYIQVAYDMTSEEKQKQEFNSFRNIPDSFKKIVVVNGTKKPWRNEEGFVIMGMKYFLLNADSLEF